jgi:hypothetical protein
MTFKMSDDLFRFILEKVHDDHGVSLQRKQKSGVLLVFLSLYIHKPSRSVSESISRIHRPEVEAVCR